ncbi:type II secretion system protein GspL [Undibacterium arcticum]|uniref:Type II secretion system protein GspL n=1 Tax=Undibacterium arcticum TaxID=1762892 RepID=A0ABV7F147_9BURK
MSTLYICHPSKAAADHAPPGTTLACPFAWVSDAGAILREGSSALSALSGLIAEAKRVVLLLAASDVSLLRVTAPPLSAPRLKAALRSLVEDQLISDPADCVLVAAAADPAAEGVRTVAVAQRAWLTQLANSLTSLGARRVEMLPAQLCLPYQSGQVTAAVSEGNEVELTLRLSAQEGIGLPVLPEHDEARAQEVLQNLRVIVPAAAVTLYVPATEVGDYRRLADQNMTVEADQWSYWIAGARAATLDLMPELGLGGGSSIDWYRWRWPLGLGLLIVVINVVGLNIEWWRMKREGDSLRNAMVQTFKSAYPKETVIVDPMVQMQQKLAIAKHNAGQSAPDDFTALAAAFGEVWSGVMQGKSAEGGSPAGASGIASLEYRERSLLVKLKPDNKLTVDAIKSALAARNLSVAQTAGGAWQIRSGK